MLGAAREMGVVVEAEPTILDASDVLGACAVLDGEAAILPAEPLTPVSASEEVLAEIEGSITVRERRRALPWTGQRLRLCRDGTGRRRGGDSRGQGECDLELVRSRLV